jgi:hypothetical protein
MKTKKRKRQAFFVMKRIKILLLSHSHSGLIFSQPPPIYYRINLNPLDYSQVHHHQEIYYLSHQQQPNLPRICLLQALPPISLQQAKVQVFWVEVNLETIQTQASPFLNCNQFLNSLHQKSQKNQSPIRFSLLILSRLRIGSVF